MKLTPQAMLLGLTLLAFSPAPSSAAERRMLDSRVPSEARSQSFNALPATKRLELAIGLRLRDQQVLTNLLRQIYDTHSRNFHRYLTPEQFAGKFGPTLAEYEEVKAFVRSNHLRIVREFDNRALLNVSGEVSDIEKMFQVHLRTYQHPTEKRQFFAPDVAPSVDSRLPVLYVSGLDNYFIPKPQGHRVELSQLKEEHPAGGSGKNALYLGNDFRNAYFPDTTLTGSGQTLGVYEPQGYTPSDIQTYATLAGLTAVPLHNILNSFPPSSGNDEVASDIELPMAMAPGLKGINVYEDTDASTAINEMASPSEGEALPNQISCSWSIEADTNIIPGLIELAMQGQSFFFAIGDSGAYPNGVNTSTYQTLLYMVAVGGTRLFMTNSGGGWQSETVWDDPPEPTGYEYFASTGGVLTQAPIPDFQKGVSMALNQGSTLYRDVPDVALVARDIEIVFTTTNGSGDYVVTNHTSDWVGTSAAAPLWAGSTALLNQQAAGQGLPTIGFLLPAVYDIGESQDYTNCFHDITVGSNVWYLTSAYNSDNLYYATNGYDLCTGWGTPNGANLFNTLLGFTGPVFVDFNYTGSKMNGTYPYPFNTLAQATNVVQSGGTIIFKTAGSSSETMTISKPMKINASDGADTVGN